MSTKRQVTYKGVELKVEYNFTPYYAGVWRYADGSGQPPEPAYAEILSVKIADQDITELIEMDLENIEELIIEIEESNEED